MRIWKCAAVVIGTMLMASPLQAQVATGTILGNVTDTLRGRRCPERPSPPPTSTRSSRATTTTDESGQYALRLLPVGNYKVDVTLDGFKNFSQTGIVLEVGRNARIDATIEPGNVSEIVSVVADAPLVETTRGIALAHGGSERSAEPAAGQSRPLLAAEPHRRRHQQRELELARRPGADSPRSTDRRARRSARVNFQLDGGNNTAGLRGTGNPAPNPEAIQEFRVITNSYAAEYGRYPAGVVDVVTKSGTNQFHGAAFEFFRNEKLEREALGAARRDRRRRTRSIATSTARRSAADRPGTRRSSSPATPACARKKPTIATPPSCPRRSSARATSRSRATGRTIR